MSQLLLQPFVNYNLSDGWYLVSSPLITSDWNKALANAGRFRSVAGLAKSSRSVGQPMNAQLQAFAYVEKPTGGPQWAIRFQVQFLVPR